MSLFGALGAATSGLRATQAGIDVVAQNVANADTIGYSRRRLSPIETVAGDRSTGVRIGAVERILDAVAQKQLRLETSGAAYTATGARFASALDRLFGTPGSAGSLDSAVNDFTLALQTLAGDPGSTPARRGALSAGAVLASRIASVAEGVQLLRGEAEGGLAASVRQADDLLSEIASLNGAVMNSRGTSPGLLDQRDRLITELSGLIDLQVIKGENGSIGLATTSGMTLVSGTSSVSLTFDARSAIGANSLFSTDPATRGVGTILARTLSGGTVDMVAGNMIRSGEIKAQLELRDTTLVQAQRQLDELAAGLSRALSDREVAGTPAVSGATTGFDIDLAGLQAGNPITVEYTDNAVAPPTPRRVVLIPTKGAAPAAIDPAEIGEPGAIVRTINISGTTAAIAADIQSALGTGFTAAQVGSTSTVRILDNGTATGPDIAGVKATITATGLTGSGAALPFFVDGGHGKTPFTGSFEGGSHLTGLAQRMVLNPLLAADSSRLVVYSTSPATPQGDATRPQHLLDALTGASRTFTSAAGIGGGGPYSSAVADFARRVVEHQGANAEEAMRIDEGQQIALTSIESRFAESAGVNIDQEMTQLVALQTAYGANARVMTAVRDMLDMLMRI